MTLGKYKYTSLIYACLIFWMTAAHAFDSFVIKDIKMEGLQRITLGTAFNYLPIKVGDTLTADEATKSIRALFKTGFFDDVWFTRDGDVLVIHVKERPSIASVKIFGNKEITTEDLNKALKGVGLAEGRVFNRSLLDQVEQELNRQYFNQGRYDVKIDTTITNLERNRVSVELDIKEGEPARIKHINIVGEKAFSEATLLSKLQLTMPDTLSAMWGSDKYSKQQLVGDLEALRSYYMNRGYIKFRITSTQVSISPDKRDVFIDINVNEGERYTVKDIKISGNLVVDEKDLRKLITMEPGETFSRQKVIESTTQINDRLGVDGYAFANVNAVPDINDKAKEVSLTFFVDPGKRVYVRRINVTGNTKTRDEVIRRELRQMEGGWISTPLINRSKTRLQRLGFFDEVKVDTVPVSGTTDQVDVDFNVTEGSTGNFTAGIGYGQEGGFLFNTSVTLNNYLGTGKRVSVELNKSQINEVYNFSFNDPYYTLDGISAGFNVFYRSTNAANANIGAYNSDDRGMDINFGIPFTEYVTGRTGMSFKRTEILFGTNTPVYFKDWLSEYGNDNKFNTYSLTGSLSYDSRDRTLFPTSGVLSQINAQATIPGGTLDYYKTSYNMSWYFPLARQVTLLLGGNIGYGSGYRDTKDLPFYENFYAGGTRSVRGFEGNTIGPISQACTDVVTTDSTGAQTTTTVCNNEPVGGNKRLLGKAELFIPNPLSDEQSKNFRLSLFYDMGRVYGSGTGVIPDDRVRSAMGLAAVWITPVGALMFNWSWPIQEYPGDRPQRFQFNIGAPF